jgi:hypothetical protein
VVEIEGVEVWPGFVVVEVGEALESEAEERKQNSQWTRIEPFAEDTVDTPKPGGDSDPFRCK